MIKNLLFIAITTTSLNMVCFAQRVKPTPRPTVTATPLPLVTPSPTPTPVTTDIVVAEAAKQAAAYRAAFNNLVANETKTFDQFDKNGAAKKSRSVDSNFLVYQSSKNADSATEYRNITSVDGKAVGDNEKRAADFFEKALKSTTADKELAKIQEESNRYDTTLDISGLTLNQSPVLADHIRPAFDFRLSGGDSVAGAETYLIEYQQKSPSPYIIVNGNDAGTKLSLNFEVKLPGDLKDAQLMLRGRLWVDKTTFQIRREVRELTVQPRGSSTIVTAIETEFEYQPSSVGILTPKTIALTDYAIKSKDKGNDITAVKDTKVTFTYTNFTQSGVDVKSGDVSPTKP
jgi:hypothetical protein